MPETCLSLWPTDKCQWSVVDIWRWSDLLQRAIYISLGLMLVYTCLVVIRLFARYRFARRELHDCKPKFSPDFCRHQRDFIAKLTRGAATLRGFAYAAPFLALVGTSYGILAAPSWIHPHIRGSFVSSLSQDFATTLLNTTIGILVAVSATISHNVLRACAETLSWRLLPKRSFQESDSGSFQYAQTLPLKMRISGPPHFALFAAPVLAFLGMAYVVFRPYPIPTGLPVALLAVRPADRVYYPKPLVVTILGRRDDIPLILVNSEEVPWGNLQQVAKAKLGQLGEPRAYVEADEIVYWGHIVYAIDVLESLHCRVLLLTSTPARRSNPPYSTMTFPIATPHRLR
jgi:hypothetical protein